MAWIDIETHCKKVPEGVWALNIRQSFGVNVEMNQNVATAQFLDQDTSTGKTNTCSINPAMNSEKAASYFVHEMVHASRFHNKEAVDISESDVEKFVSAALTEEYLATDRQMRFFMRAVLKGLFDSLKPFSDKNSPPKFDNYYTNFGIFQNQITQGGQFSGDAIIEQTLNRCSGAVRLWIYGAPQQGERPALGVGVLSYEQNYRRNWARAHRN